MHAPPPVELGRGVLVGPGAAAPEPWGACARVRIDDAALAAPGEAVAALHRAFASRAPVVVELAVDPARFREPTGRVVEPWTVGAEHEEWFDRLHFLVWANTYDARDGAPVWWWGRKAARLGAEVIDEGTGDVQLADGTRAWVDGGPRGTAPTTVAGLPVIHRETVDLGALTPVPPDVAAPAAEVELAADQLAAVRHRGSAARVIAPAGSGKTRVLTERLRELLGPRGYERETVLAVAYNRKAQEEMAARTTDLGARTQTLNAWGYTLVSRWLGRRPPVLDEREVRRIVESLVPRQRRRVNTDPLAPYLDGLSQIRLGLRDPAEVEATLDDVAGLAEAFPRYRAELQARRALDFDEQVYLALEALLHDGPFRRAMQAEHRHLLVDELQDLTPAHVLLCRLVSTPTFDVFGVGDDDQTIYGHAGADPRFLIDFDRYFPGAHAHALEVNYRCPAAVTGAAATLLSYNRRRVEKQIRPGPDADPSTEGLSIRTHAAADGASTLVQCVRGLLDRGVDARDIAVLTRVNSLLLAPHVALSEARVPLDSVLTVDVLGRLGVRAALAYVRLAVAPGSIDPADLVEVHRRPSRGLPNWAERWLGRCRSLPDVQRAAERIDDAKVSAKLRDLANDLARLADLASAGASTRELLTAVRDDIGLGSAMTLLDSTGGAAGSHLDDLEALVQVADLASDPASFEPWLRSAFHRERNHDGVTLSTIHRVKGREWPDVVVFGVTDGLVPHRLATDIEEERRVLHVAVTRGRGRVVVLGDAERRSPFLDELTGAAPRDRALAPPRTRRDERPAVRPSDDPAVDVRVAALRAWRLERSRRDGVPAFVVLSDKHLDGIARRAPTTLVQLRACPGIGPAKLESYGDELLEVLATVSEASATSGTATARRAT